MFPCDSRFLERREGFWTASVMLFGRLCLDYWTLLSASTGLSKGVWNHLCFLASAMLFGVLLPDCSTFPSAFMRFYIAFWHQFCALALYICLLRFACYFVVRCTCSADVCLCEILRERSVSVRMTVRLSAHTGHAVQPPRQHFIGESLALTALSSRS